MTKAKRKSRAKPVTLRGALDYLDRILVKQDETSKELWNVLSALRGPDIDPEPFNIKDLTTVHIRRAAFPLCKATETFVNGACFFGYEDFNPFQGHLVSTHFGNHIENAAKALGLTADDTESTL